MRHNQTKNGKQRTANRIYIAGIDYNAVCFVNFGNGNDSADAECRKRQKELRLRESLRMIRNAIDEFKRDTVGACPQGAITTTNRVPNSQGGAGFGQATTADPRSRVVIDDCKIFDTENLDRYPPSLDILVEGVAVKERGINLQQQNTAFSDRNATDIASNGEQEERKKVYLREIPVDPMTGETDWKLRSSFQPGDAESWDDINVFDVSSSFGRRILKRREIQ